MNSFLRETFELWYWAFCLPTTLQRRLNQWVTVKDGDLIINTSPRDALFSNIHPRFLVQHLLLTLLLSLPLLATVSLTGNLNGIFLLPLVLLISYSVSIVILPVGINVPLVFLLVYLGSVATQQAFLDKTFDAFPTALYCFTYSGIGMTGLMLTLYVGQWLSELDQVALGVKKNVIGKIIVGLAVVTLGTVSTYAICWLNNQSLSSVIYIEFLVNLWLLASLILGYSESRISVAVGLITALMASFVAFAHVFYHLYGFINIIAVLATSVVALFATFICAGGALTHLIPTGPFTNKLITEIGSRRVVRRGAIKLVFARLILCYLAVLGGILIGLLIAIILSSFTIGISSVHYLIYFIICWLVAYSW